MGGRPWEEPQRRWGKYYKINGIDGPHSVLVTIGGEQVGALIDTGAAISLIERRVARKLEVPLIRLKEYVVIESILGEKMSVKGTINVSIRLGTRYISHRFYVVGGIRQKMILGRDFLNKNRVTIYCGEKLEIGKEEIKLAEEKELYGVVRISKSVVLKPRTINFVQTKIENGTGIRPGLCIRTKGAEHIQLETPEIEITEGIVKLNRSLTFPVMLINNAEKTISLKKDTEVGIIERMYTDRKSKQIVENRGRIIRYGWRNGFNKSRNHKNRKQDWFGEEERRNRSWGGKQNKQWSGQEEKRYGGGQVNAIHEKWTGGRKFVCSVNQRTKREERLNTLRGQIVVDEQNRQKIEEFVLQNEDVFALSDLELGCTKTVLMEIDTNDAAPVNVKPYNTPLQNRPIVEKAIQDMLKAGIIRRIRSAWQSPVVLVKKQDGSHRFCCDYRALNKITTTISQPLPKVDEILAKLHESKYFTTLDARSGFWTIGMSEEAQEKAAFGCHVGTFAWNRLPFGLKNSPSAYMSLMNEALEGLETFAEGYMDDILIHTKDDIEDHLNKVRIVFDRLRQHDIKLKLTKCAFLKTELKYLGFVINKEGVKPELDKVKAIRELKPPRTVREVRSFIGMCGYYRRFVPEFSRIAEPIVALTRKRAKYSWSAECQKAFELLKDSLTKIPLLVHPDVSRKLVLHTDASEYAIGACLQQPILESEDILPGESKEEPIYYLSHSLSKAQRKWSTFEREAYAVYYSIKKLNFYLENTEFIVRTDHKPLEILRTKEIQNKKVQNWAMNLQGYNFTIEHIPGKENKCADLLSRIPQDTENTNEEFENNHTGPDERNFQLAVINSNKVPPTDETQESSEEEIEDRAEQAQLGAITITEQEKDIHLRRIRKDLRNKKKRKNYRTI
jgi:hypothetical protein